MAPKDYVFNTDKESSETNRNSVKLKAGKISSEQTINTTLVCLSPTIPLEYSYVNALPIAPFIPQMMTSMATYYHTCSHPIPIQDWCPMSRIQTQNSIYTIPYQPVTYFAQPMIQAPICPLIAPVLEQHIFPDISNVHVYETVSCYAESSLNNINEDITYQNTVEQVYYEKNIYHANDYVNDVSKTAVEDKYSDNYDNQNVTQADPLEEYLYLPRDVFPTPRMITVDPNPLIDEFCKLENCEDHAPWLLDLEFGVPKSPITRSLPTYDVKFNSIHCKNSPNAIHPGFESCNQEFKRVLLFYYDCIVSSWYKGFIVSYCDTSVENFQNWLLLPMQVFGMCWP